MTTSLAAVVLPEIRCWSGPHDRPRVLVETPAGRWHAENAAAAAGLEVLVCPGPREGRCCPVLDGDVCPLAAAADAIVVAQPPRDERWGALMEAHRPLHPGVPLCVEFSRAQAGDPDSVLRLPAAPEDGRATVALVERVARVHARRSDGWLGGP